MINFWYYLDWKIQYVVTIVLVISLLQFSNIVFYSNANSKEFVESEEKKIKNEIIKETLKKKSTNDFPSKKDKINNINNITNSIEMKNKAIQELYLNEDDLSSNQIETVEHFQNRSDIINYNLRKVEESKHLEKNNKIVKNKSKKYNFKINFFPKSNTFQLFRNNNYIDKMNSINLKARQFSSLAELTIKYMDALLPITKKEKAKTYKLVNNMLVRLQESDTKSVLPKFLKETLAISTIAKSSSWLEGGMPHTHDKTVILPESWFKDVASYFKGIDNKIAFNGSTLMHELVHIHQRVNPDLYYNIYREWGFIKVDFMDNMSHILELNRNNPDGLQDKWIWVDRSQKGKLNYYWIGAIFKDKNYPVITRVNYFAYKMNKIENTYENDIKIVRLSENPPIPLSEFDSFNEYFGITNNHYHPNEIIAQYIEELYGEVLNNKQHIKNPAYNIFKLKWSLHY